MGVPDPATGYQLPSAVPARTEQITDRVIPDGASTPVFRYFGTDDPKEIDEVQLGTDVAGITGADEEASAECADDAPRAPDSNQNRDRPHRKRHTNHLIRGQQPRTDEAG